MDVASAEAFFLEQLETIERVLSFTCRRHSLQRTDAEDFSSWVKLKLIENDYGIIRKFDGRSFAAYVSIVVHRLLLDYRIHYWGKWHASAEARRQGEVGIALEAMLVRDGRSIDEALPALRRIQPDLSAAAVHALAALLPARAPRTRFVEVDEVVDKLAIPADSVEDGAATHERAGVWWRIQDIVNTYFNGIDEEDRRILRLRFGAGLSVADIARALRIEQKPLYRKLGRHVTTLKRRLQLAGICWNTARELLEHPADDVDFHFLQAGTDSADNMEDEP